jgi:hypothetical protein
MNNFICYNSAINLSSSLVFGISAYYSSIYKNVVEFECGCFFVLCSSILYHGARTLKLDEDLIEALKVIDIINVYVCILYFTYLSLGFNIWYGLGWVCILYMLTLYYWFNASNHPEYGHYLHSSIHIISNIGIAFMIESYLLINSLD